MRNIKPRPRTNQEAFDNVWQHFVVENNPRATIAPEDLPDEVKPEGGFEDTDTPVCVYRGEGGKMCAIGCQLPDDLYEPSMECKPVVRLLKVLRARTRVGNYFGHVDTRLLTDLQGAHDWAIGVLHGRDLAERLRDVAHHWGLTVPETPTNVT
jgi:hypothetical protein